MGCTLTEKGVELLAGIFQVILLGTVPGLGEFVVIVKVPYFLIIKSISDYCTGFPILGFSGGFHTQNNSVNIVM